MHKRLVLQCSLVLALAMPVAVFAATDAPVANGRQPTIDDIYKAAQAGRFSDADAMIAQVLASHPDSAKAHYVHSELLAKEGKIAAAKSEYAKAVQLAPGLPFAKPESVAALAQKLGASGGAASTTSYRVSEPSMPAATAYSPGIGAPAKFGIVLVLLAAGVFMYRRLSAGRAQVNNAASRGYATPSYANAPTAYAPAGMSPGGYAPQAPAGGGLGSALMTGAAMGLGAVAVEEAVRHFSHRDDSGSGLVDRQVNSPGFGSSLMPDGNADMGGNDFGISDVGSWDVGGGDVGDDW